jgi:hypothetical protein
VYNLLKGYRSVGKFKCFHESGSKEKAIIANNSELVKTDMRRKITLKLKHINLLSLNADNFI